MKKVTKTFNIYNFDELDKATQERLLDNERQDWQNLNFEFFSSEVYDELAELTGLDPFSCDIQYSLTFCQGDGLCFDCDNLLSKKIIDIIKSELTKSEKMQFTKLLNSGYIEAYSKNFNSHYCYATPAQVNVTIEAPTQKQEALEQKIYNILSNFYLQTCKALERTGYNCFEVSDKDLLESLKEHSYYYNGVIYE